MAPSAICFWKPRGRGHPSEIASRHFAKGLPPSDRLRSLAIENLRRRSTKKDMTSPAHHPRDPLHGITLEQIINQLVQQHGWAEMGRRIPVRCFQFNPTVKSSLTFLRKTPWARKKVEDWFIGGL